MNDNNKWPPPVNVDIIENKFITLREAPITVFGVSVDCDEDSLNTMRQALKYFDEQPLKQNVFEEVSGEKCVEWRLSDNSTKFLTKEQLQSFLYEIEKEKALRTSKLYSKKRTIKDNGCIFEEVHEDWV